MKELVTLFSFIALLGLLLAACGGAAPSTQAPSAATEPPAAATEAPAVATEASEPTAMSLVGTTWKLARFGPADSPKPVVPESEGMIIFGADGKVTGIGACNQFDGEYEIKGEQIAWGPFSWGMEICLEPKMTQESGVYDVISNPTVDFKIVGNNLTITRKSLALGELVLVFEAVGDSTGN